MSQPTQTFTEGHRGRIDEKVPHGEYPLPQARNPGADPIKGPFLKGVN